MASIQGVYVALFGRPADPTGLAYFNSITNGGQNLAGIANLAGTAEYQSRFTGLNNVQIINSIYQSLFGRDADLAGLNFFADALSKGTLNINNIAIAILDGAQGNDKTIVTNKVNAADAYTKALDTGAEVVAYSGTAAAAQGVAFLKTVTTTAPTAAQVDAAVATMVTASTSGGTGTTGVTIALASGTDNVNPNSTESKFKSTDNNDTIIAGNNLASTVVVDAGNGTDTLTASLADSTTAVTPNLKSVEVVTLTTQGTNGAVATGFAFDANNSTGINTLNIKGLTVANTKAATLANVTKTTAVNLDTVNAAAGGAATVTVGYKDASGATDAATISLSKTGSGTTGNVTLAATGIENLTIQSNGSAATDTNKLTLDATDAKAVVLSGSNTLTLTETGTVTGVKSYDASAMTGNLDFTVKAGAHSNGLTIALGKGTDTLTLTGSSTSETIVYNSNNLSTVAKTDKIVDFEFGTSTTAKDLIDLKAFNLGSDTTVKITTLSSTGSNVPNMFDVATKNWIAVKVIDDNNVDVYIDVNKDGLFDAASDMRISLNTTDIGKVGAVGIDKTDFILA